MYVNLKAGADPEIKEGGGPGHTYRAWWGLVQHMPHSVVHARVYIYIYIALSLVGGSGGMLPQEKFEI